MTILEALTAVKSALNEVHVSGEDDMDKLLGSIRAVGQCIAALSAPPATVTMPQKPESAEHEMVEGNKHADPDSE